MSVNEGDRLEATLLRIAGDDADVVRTAQAIVELWTRVDAALGPVIGRGGVAAMLQRCLHQTGQSHAWLLQALGIGPPGPIDLQSLRAVFASQSAAEAAAAGAALFHHFHALLSSLIGSALSERLLHDVHPCPPGEGLSQDL